MLSLQQHISPGRVVIMAVQLTRGVCALVDMGEMSVDMINTRFLWLTLSMSRLVAKMRFFLQVRFNCIIFRPKYCVPIGLLSDWFVIFFPSIHFRAPLGCACIWWISNPLFL